MIPAIAVMSLFGSMLTPWPYQLVPYVICMCCILTMAKEKAPCR